MVQVNIKNLIDEVQCYQTVRELRWPDGITCPSCQSKQVIKRGFDDTEPARQRYECTVCHTRFDDLTDTILTVSPLLTLVASRNLLLYQSLPTRMPDREAKVRRRKDDTGVGTATSSNTEGLSRFSRRVQPHGGPLGRVRRALSTGS